MPKGITFLQTIGSTSITGFHGCQTTKAVFGWDESMKGTLLNEEALHALTWNFGGQRRLHRWLRNRKLVGSW